MNKIRSGKKKRIFAIAVFALYLLCVSAIVPAVTIINKYYNDMYNNDVEFSDGVMDLRNYNGIEKNGEYTIRQQIALQGKLELYYNVWLVADGEEDRKPDGYVTVFDFWTSVKKDGKRLPSSGYATYRYTIINNAHDGYFSLRPTDSLTPWKMYVNRKLVAEYGEMGKTRETSKAIGKVKNYTYAYPTEKGQSYEITIEIGFTDFAFGAPNRLAVTPNYGKISEAIDFFIKKSNIVSYITIGMLAACTIILLLFAVATNKYKNIVTFATIIIMLILSLMSSLDFMHAFAALFPTTSRAVMPYTAYVVGWATFVAFAVHLGVNKQIKFRQDELLIWCFGNFVFAVMTCCFRGYKEQFYFILINICWFNYLIYKIYRNTEIGRIEKSSYAVILIVLSWFYLMEAFDYLGMASFSGGMAYSYGIILMSLGIVGIYFIRFNELNVKALAAEKGQREKAVFKAQVLKSQIKPHFIFNTLTLIMDCYRQSFEKGEKMLKMFAKYMRVNVDADVKVLVPFEEELHSVDMYFEICNERTGGRLNLYHDVAEYDFLVPLLSLQPIVENAIKYSGIEEIDEGYILIKSYRDEKTADCVVEVSDNGKGFDVTQIRQDSVGIRNVKERMSILLNAKTEIKSVIGEGTTVKITIPNLPPPPPPENKTEFAQNGEKTNTYKQKNEIRGENSRA